MTIANVHTPSESLLLHVPGRQLSARRDQQTDHACRELGRRESERAIVHRGMSRVVNAARGIDGREHRPAAHNVHSTAGRPRISTMCARQMLSDAGR